MEEPTKETKSLRKAKRTKNLQVLLAVIIFVGAVVGVSKLASDQDTHPSEPAAIAVIRITKTGFEPATLSVKQGTKVIWTNTDGSLHQIAANPYPKGTSLPSLKSEILNNAQTYTYIANATGSFGYHDQLSPTTNGTLVVQKR